ncbi:hypothetical protein OXYTRIMIC_340 [Oxytricha trifallax]|uniref:Uncharacterized protein n=1 Tax=Oxytricha trifallax TaxID=1172189 RepID=A0A073HYN6_9SPIT|nr:hypothetical protein OXYTRIMIC_340 [Oxytricha trifallax]
MNIDFQNKLEELQKSNRTYLTKQYSNFIEMVKSKIVKDIDLSKESKIQIEKAKEAFIKVNKNLIDSGKFNSEDMEKFFDKQIWSLNIFEKEEFLQVICVLFHEQEQPQNLKK